MLLIVIVYVLLLQLGRRPVEAPVLVIVVAVLEILHLQEIIIPPRLLVAMLMVDSLSHWLVLLI